MCTKSNTPIGAILSYDPDDAKCLKKRKHWISPTWQNCRTIESEKNSKNLEKKLKNNNLFIDFKHS